MKVDIWSDIRCPFCYIGKRKFEAALDRFEHKDKIDITWHSFELDPSLKTQSSKNIYDYLAERKGVSRERAEQMHGIVEQRAKDVGLTFNFEKAVVASSFDAHRLLQFAKSKGIGNEAKERLFKAYYTEGKDISDHDTLVQLGKEIGLDEEETGKMLRTGAFADEVRYDESKASRIGITGVPFFVIDEKYGISGAQEPEVFLETLRETWQEKNEKIENEKGEQIVANDGGTCSIDGTCN